MRSRRSLLVLSLIVAGLLLAGGWMFAAGRTDDAATVSDKKAEPITVDWWVRGGQTHIESLKDLVKKFEGENPNIKVEIMVAASTSDLHQKCLAALAAGNPPDVRRAKPYQMADYASRGALLNLEEYVKRDKIDLTQYPELVIKYESYYQGEFVIFPWFQSVPALFVNDDLMKKAGLTGHPETWDDLVSFGKKLTDPSNDQWGYMPYAWPDSANKWQRTFILKLWQAGGKTFTDDLKKVAFNSSAGKEAIQVMVDAVEKHKITPPPERRDAKQIFAGKVGIFESGQWDVANLAKQAPDMNYSTYLLAAHPRTGKRTTMSMSAGFSIFKDAKQPEGAWELIKFMARPDSQKEMCVRSGFVPGTMKMVDTPPFNAAPWKAFVEQIATDINVRPLLPGYEECVSIIGEELESAVYKKKTVDQALDDAEKRVNAVLAEVRW